MHRREFLAGVLTVTFLSSAAMAHEAIEIDPKYLPQQVRFTGYTPGTIVVDPAARYLYLVEQDGFARRYGVGVGRAGLSFSGDAVIGRKAEWPRWTPTANMIKRSPEKYARHAGGLKGGPRNPLGARALYLYKDGRDTLYRIHGTTEPNSIGRAVSNGCIRMINEHVVDLYDRTEIGMRVVVR